VARDAGAQRVSASGGTLRGGTLRRQRRHNAPAAAVLQPSARSGSRRRASTHLAVHLQALDALHAQQPQRVQRVAVAQQLALTVLTLQLERQRAVAHGIGNRVSLRAVAAGSCGSKAAGDAAQQVAEKDRARHGAVGAKAHRLAVGAQAASRRHDGGGSGGSAARRDARQRRRRGGAQLRRGRGGCARARRAPEGACEHAHSRCLER
jgi:hypothetical protein